MSEITAKGLPGQDCEVSFNCQAKRSHSKKITCQLLLFNSTGFNVYFLDNSVVVKT